MSQEKLGTQTSIKREMAKIYSVGGILMWKFFKNFLSRVLRQMEQHRNMLTKESEGKRVTESPHFLKKGPQSRNGSTQTFSAGISLFHKEVLADVWFLCFPTIKQLALLLSKNKFKNCWILLSIFRVRKRIREGLAVGASGLGGMGPSGWGLAMDTRQGPESPRPLTGTRPQLT